MLLEDDVLLTVDIINAAAVKKNLDFIIYFGSTVPDVVRAAGAAAGGGGS